MGRYRPTASPLYYSDLFGRPVQKRKLVTLAGVSVQPFFRERDSLDGQRLPAKLPRSFFDASDTSRPPWFHQEI